MSRCRWARFASRKNSRDERGFSLAEMLTVLAIIGITAGLGVYTINLAGWRSSSACSDITARLQKARGRAAFEQNNYSIFFLLSQNKYRILDDDNSNGAYNPAIGETLKDYYVSTQGSGMVFGYPTGTKGIDGNTIPAAVTFPGTPPVLTFNPLGEGTNGVIYLIPNEDISTNDPSHMRAISVNQATGRVRRWRYDEKISNPGPWRLEQ